MYPEFPGVDQQRHGEGEAGQEGEGGVKDGQHEQDVAEGGLHVQVRRLQDGGCHKVTCRQ